MYHARCTQKCAHVRGPGLFAAPESASARAHCLVCFGCGLGFRHRLAPPCLCRPAPAPQELACGPAAATARVLGALVHSGMATTAADDPQRFQRGLASHRQKKNSLRLLGCVFVCMCERGSGNLGQGASPASDSTLDLMISTGFFRLKRRLPPLAAAVGLALPTPISLPSSPLIPDAWNGCVWRCWGGCRGETWFR
jgi:hypothetical protein